MSTTHYENANFLRELAENLPNILPNGSADADKAALLQRLADDELAQAEYDDWVRDKVATARADTRPRLTTEQVRQRLQTRYQELREQHDAV
ncbi:plasmid stabilization protein [Salmonella enterica]